MPRNSRPRVRSVRVLLVAWGMATLACSAEPAPRRVPDTMAQRVQPCTVCHGPEGRASNAGYFPRIAGKPAGYLYNQLINFREGRRTHAAMTHLVDYLSDAYLREMADHFAALDLPYPVAQTRDALPRVLSLGQSLVLHGDAQRRIPACVACHGAAMTGIAPAVPGLLGLPRDYVVAQLGAWQTGKRHATAPDCMGQIATQLTAGEISAVATWLSAQPLPAQSRALPGRTTDWPLECGSGTR